MLITLARVFAQGYFLHSESPMRGAGERDAGQPRVHIAFSDRCPEGRTRQNPSPVHWYPAAVIAAGRAQWGETVIGVLLSYLTDGLLSLKRSNLKILIYATRRVQAEGRNRNFEES
jgi:hypothetical protein